MAERSYTTYDKTEWGEGPWQSEPDKVQYVDETTGMDCLIVRNRLGGLCGYVGVTPEHPWHGVSYSGSFDENCDEWTEGPESKISVHGGLTFSEGCDEDAPPEAGICHIPEPGRPDNVWWFGFDCGHAGDYMPAMAARERALGLTSFAFLDRPQDVYRDMDYVRAEIRSLAEQLAAVQDG